MRSTLPETFQNNVVIKITKKKERKNTIRDTKRKKKKKHQHHMTQHFNFSLVIQVARSSRTQNYYGLSLSEMRKFAFNMKFIEELLCPSSQYR